MYNFKARRDKYEYSKLKCIKKYPKILTWKKESNVKSSSFKYTHKKVRIPSFAVINPLLHPKRDHTLSVH